MARRIGHGCPLVNRYGLILASLRGASHLVVTAAFSVVAALATALPILWLGLSPFPERFFDRDCSLKLLTLRDHVLGEVESE